MDSSKGSRVTSSRLLLTFSFSYLSEKKKSNEEVADLWSVRQSLLLSTEEAFGSNSRQDLGYSQWAFRICGRVSVLALPDFVFYSIPVSCVNKCIKGVISTKRVP